LDLKKKGLLVNNTIVVTVMSNMGVDVFAKKHGINVVKTQVGDRYVLEEMLRSGCIIGGEQSGHVIMLQHNTTGDGLITAVQLVRVLKNEGCRLSDLASVFTRFPQVGVNAKVRDSLKHKFMDDDDIAAMCRSLEDEFGENGRVLIRPSGTEPLVRVMIEGENTAYIKHKAELLAALIESRLGT
jgi:phosphoglucosamine mutase